MSIEEYEARILELEAQLAAAYDTEPGEAITWRHTADTQAEYIIHLEIQLAKVSYAQQWQPVPDGWCTSPNQDKTKESTLSVAYDGAELEQWVGSNFMSSVKISLPDSMRLYRRVEPKEETRLEVKFLGSTYGPPDETPEARAERYLETARRYSDTGRLTEEAK